MKDRLVTAAGALLALVASIAILVADRPPPISSPTSSDSGPNGYSALQDWLAEAGIPVASLRSRIDQESLEMDRGDLMITTMPHRIRMRPEETNYLKAWVGHGNTLLVMAALNDQPNWAGQTATKTFRGDVAELTGLQFEAVERGTGGDIRVGMPGRQTPIVLNAFQGHPLNRNSETFEGVTDNPTRIWSTMPLSGRLRLRLAEEADHEPVAAWHLPFGSGHILFVGLGSMLTNRAIGRADNRQLVVELIRHLVPGRVIFDDKHQGLSSAYDPSAFYRDPRLHISVLFVLGFWMVYMVGSWNRLAPPRPETPVPGQQDFVRAVGGFLARKVDPVECGRMMFASRFSEMAGRPVPFDQPPWATLRANPLVDQALVDRLIGDHTRLSAGDKVDLKKLHNRIRAL